MSVGNTNFFTSTNNIGAPLSAPSNDFDDTLSNGKTLIKPTIVSMPTIIKPVSMKGKSSPTHIELKKTDTIKEIPREDSFEEYDDPPSPPMPTIPPPPPPTHDILDVDEDKEPFGIALYDFESELEEDLNFRVSKSLLFLSQV